MDDSSKSLNYSSVTYQYVEKETACLLINRLREKKNAKEFISVKMSDQLNNRINSSNEIRPSLSESNDPIIYLTSFRVIFRPMVFITF